MANFAFPECSVQRIKKYQGVTLFTVTTRKSYFYCRWRKALVDVLCRYRVIEPSLKRKILDGEQVIYVCERHFTDEDIERAKTGQKSLRLEAVPTKHLPAKSQDKPKIERRELVRNENLDFQVSDKHCYQIFDEFCSRAQRLQLTNWDININKDIVNLKKFISPYTLPYCDITILGWILPDTHSLYKTFCRSVRNVTLSELLKRIIALNLCCGVNIETYSEKVISHVIPCNINLDDIDPNNPFPRKLYQRPADCIVLNDNLLCNICKSYQRSKDVVGKPLHINAPLSTAKEERLIETIKEQRIVLSFDEMKIKENLVYKYSGQLVGYVDLGDPETNYASFKDPDSLATHVLVFYIRGLATHVLVFSIRGLATHVLVFSIRGLATHVLVFSIRGLATHVLVFSIRGLATHVLVFSIRGLATHVLVFSIRGLATHVLVFSIRGLATHVLVFSIRGLATHVLVFSIRGLASDLKFELGYFGTRDVTAHQLMMQFWNAVAVLEDTCKWHVIAAVSDGISSNRAFTAYILDSGHKNVVHRTINLYARDRYIYFFADAPHLMETTRNCV